MERHEIKALVIEAIKEAGFTSTAPAKRYVYGQKGVAEIFGCSIPTASRILASGKIAGAVSKIGRCIVVDVEQALELAKRKEGGRRWKG